ncbi:MAG: sigma 54-interacting transcriptional regulator, partial [Syntrophomonadaceae bacterium]|nr:sigma 54-interacting transcriptional regulator [Syntrophomonadaceae bacterium]
MASIMNLSVSEAMSSDYGTVNYNAPVHEVLDLMLQNQWEEVFVVDDDGKEKGLVTKEHLTRKMTEGVAEDTPVRDICVKEVFTINYDEQLTNARDFMRRHRIGRLPVKNAAGEIIGILTARDICNGFSGKLEALGNHLYSVIENIVEAVQVIDCDGKVSLWNRQAEKLFGIEAEKIIGRKLEDFIPDDLLLEVIQTGKSYNYVPAELKKGTYVVRNAVPVYNPNGNLVGAVCTTQDISYYYNLMAQLDKANSKVRSLKRTIAIKDESNEEAFYTVNFKTCLVLEQAKKVAKTDATVLIQGESGTGKELMAHVIYENSKRAKKPFIEINCCAIPETLFESEMFGYESGAFTGAQKYGKVGKFELAQGGTIFLDEIGELPLEMQGKLLRVLQEKRFYRVGGTIPINCDVRVIAATNQNLYNLVQEGKFRSDLYYRLNVVNLTIPPLRERKDDILGLTKRFIRELATSYN